MSHLLGYKKYGRHKLREFGKKIMDLCFNSNPPTEWKKVVDSGLNKWKWSSLQAVISKLTWGATIQCHSWIQRNKIVQGEQVKSE